MKKKFLAALLATAMVFSFTACGDKEDTKNNADADTFVLSEENLDSYITLNDDYDVFDVEIDPINVTEDDINTQINNLILDKAGTMTSLQTLVNRAVEDGDTVNIDYVGTRLHAGIHALNNKVRSIIIAIDNRAIEMGKDFKLPVLERTNIELYLREQINSSDSIVLELPWDKIEEWKGQFK